jgi:hypothetical protein
MDLDRGIVRSKLEPPVTLDHTEIAADDQDAAVLSGIPEDALIRIDGREVPHDVTLELIATLPSEHEIEVTDPR